MWMDLFLTPLTAAFSLTAGLILLFLLAPLFRRAPWRTEERHGYKKNLSRLGGVAMLGAFSFAVLFDPHLVLTREFYGLLLGGILILIFGLWDDLSELGWKVQVFFQVALTVLIYIFGIHITSFPNPFGGAWFFSPDTFIVPSFLILFAWVFLVMNAMNWLDGLDGLCGGVSLITFITIFFLSLKPEVYQPPMAILSVIGIGVAIGFLLFNMYPARILAGTVGSMFLGFLVATLSVIAGTKIATAFLVLALPIVDALYVLWLRLREGSSVFAPDRRHLHFRLLELGWSERQIAYFFFLVTALIAVIALSTQALGKFVAILLVLCIIFSLLFFVQYRTRLKRV
jgi:UDP-GlcNAc:undecaprenyl-phosphate GlcNAc-1-phosphate transferase